MHHAWIIVGLVFTTQFAANALGFYAFGVMLAPIAEEFGASRASVGMIPFALSVAGAVIGPILGRAVASVPIHWLMAAGALAMGSGFWAMSHATALWQLQVGYALGVALGINALAGVVPSALLVNWFEERRALAIGVAGVGISLAGFLMTPVTSSWVERFGWRGTFEIFAAIAFALVPVIWALATSHPRDRGELAYGARAAPVEPPQAADSAGVASEAGPAERPESAGVAVLSTLEALRIPSLWLIAASSGMSFMVSTAMITHIVTLGTDAGHDPVASAFLLSAAAGAAALAKLLFGWLSERIGERGAFACAIVCQIVGLIGIAELQQSHAALVASSAVFGLGMGGVMPVQIALLARVFGQANFGPVAGLSGPILIAFQAIGAPALGYAYDVQGRYGPGLWVMAAVLLVPIVGILSVRERPLPAPGAPPPAPRSKG